MRLYPHFLLVSFVRICGFVLRYLFYYKRDKSRSGKKNAENNCSVKKHFFKSSPCVKSRTEVVSKSASQTGAGLLQKHGRDKKDRQSDLNIWQKWQNELHLRHYSRELGKSKGMNYEV